VPIASGGAVLLVEPRGTNHGFAGREINLHSGQLRQALQPDASTLLTGPGTLGCGHGGVKELVRCIFPTIGARSGYDTGRGLQPEDVGMPCTQRWISSAKRNAPHLGVLAPINQR